MDTKISLEEVFKQCDKLIYSIISKYSYANKEDLYQVASIGVISAYKNYDNTKNASFTSYAYLYIVGEIKKYLREDKLLKVSREYNSLYLSINKAKNLLAQKLKMEPTNQQIASFLNIDINLVISASNINISAESLDDDEINKYDKIPSKENNLDLETLILLKEKILNLPKEDRDIIISRYFKDETQEQIAKELGISQVNVYRKEKKILNKLKSNW